MRHALNTGLLAILIIMGCVAGLPGLLPAETTSAVTMTYGHILLTLQGGTEDGKIAFELVNLEGTPVTVRLFLPLGTSAEWIYIAEEFSDGSALEIGNVEIVPGTESSEFVRDVVKRLIQAGRCRSATITSSNLISCANLIDHEGATLYLWDISLEAHGSKRFTISYSRELSPELGPALETYSASFPLSAARFWHGPVGEVGFFANVLPGSEDERVHVIEAPPGATVGEGSLSLTAKDVRPWDDLIIRYELIPAGSGREDVLMRIDPSTAYVPAGEDSSVYLLYEVTAQATAQEIARLPMDIVLVIDTSGSMDGQKIEDAKQAAYYALDNLGDIDSVSIVTFAAEAYRLSGRRHQLRGLVGSINSGGGTNLYDGLSLALDDLAASSRDALKVVFVLTDGMPTSGITNENSIAALGGRAEALGVVVSTIGFGTGVNARILRRIAEASGGNYYYSQDASFLTEFESEFSGVASSVATDAVLTATVGGRVKLVGVYGTEADVGDSAFTIPLHALRDGHTKSFEVEVTVPAIAAGESVEVVGESRLTYVAADGSTQVLILPSIVVSATEDHGIIRENLWVVGQAELDKTADLTYDAEENMMAGNYTTSEGVLKEVEEQHVILQKLGMAWNSEVALQAAAVGDMRQRAEKKDMGSQLVQNSATTATYAIRNLDRSQLLQNRRRAVGQTLSQVEDMWLTNDRISSRVRDREVIIVYGRRANGADEQVANRLKAALEAAGGSARVAYDDQVASLDDGKTYILVGGPVVNAQVASLPSEASWYRLNRGGRGTVYAVGNAVVVAGAEKEDTLAAGELVAGMLMR
ncbi:MAG: VWA domain-containing protein [Candidatus Undinarchaeales archaeon]|jgi:Ca-activated chloride channel family protein|nr:VWA domain-containing protein [Candidatus Undinarchaeales archaeon]MDP7493581.1 VWA domain-containing protein [Candidatus Undinarchaeales archaeon]